MNYHIIPIFIPHLGCPNDCVFCNQKKISGKEDFKIENAKKEISKFLKIYNYTNNIELAFYGGSFTMIDDNLQESLLELAYKLKSSGKIARIRASTRPDGINEKIIKRLKNYKLDTIELGVQSLNQEVLNKSKRGHDSASVYKASKLLKDNGIELGLQQMVGLPGDSLEKSIFTTKEIIKIGPKFVRIYPSLVLKDTELADMYKSGEYKAIDLDQAIKIVSQLLVLYKINNIKVIRIGLQASENLCYDKDVIAGPLHPAFGELVETNILVNMMKYSKCHLKENSKIRANGPIISKLVGQRACGKEELKKHFNISKIKFINDKNLSNHIIIDDKYQIDIKEGYKRLEKEWIDVSKKY